MRSDEAPASNIGSSQPRVALWCIVVVIATLFTAIVWLRWNHRQMLVTRDLWTLKDANGLPICLVQAGWTAEEVSARCGPRSGRGCQPKVVGPGFKTEDLQVCSAPGDVYGPKVILYGCDGRVQSVEFMPAAGFIYPSTC